jgi:hypothetical protein
MILAAPAAGADEFAFYGLVFGMTRDEVRAQVRTNDAVTEAARPGHGMMYLSFAYDHRDRLMEIRASYQRPDNPLAYEGLRAALREKLIQPVTTKFRNIAVTTDDYTNAAATTIVYQNVDMRQEMIDHFKAEALKSLQ